MQSSRQSGVGAIALSVRDFIVASLFVYGYAYAAIKLNDPFFVARDFFRYMHMIGRPFDFSVVPAPFVMRQIPPLVATAIYKMGLHYDIPTVGGLAGLVRDNQRRLLALVISNATAVIFAITLLFGYLRRRLPEIKLTALFSLIGILASFFWFPIHIIGPLTYGWGWFAASLFAIAFLERSATLTCVAAAVAMFSRETMIVYALGLYGLAVLLYGKSARNLIAPTLCLVFAACLYLVLRKLLAFGYVYQISPKFIIKSLFSLHTYPGMPGQIISQLSCFSCGDALR